MFNLRPALALAAMGAALGTPWVATTASAAPAPAFPGHQPGRVVLGMSCGSDCAVKQAELGTNYGVHRQFDKWGDWSAVVKDITEDHAANRLPWVSVEGPAAGSPAGWRDLAAGKYDAEIAALGKAIMTVDSKPIILTFHHEPSNDGTEAEGADYAAAFVHFSDVLKGTGALRNTSSVPILGDWLFNEKNKTQDPKNWITKDVLDRAAFLGIDIYENPSGETIGTRLQQIHDWMAAQGFGDKMLGIGEMGATDASSAYQTGPDAVQYLKDSLGWAKAHTNEIGVISYFNSTANSRPGVHWPLDESAAKMSTFQGFLADPAFADSLTSGGGAPAPAPDPAPTTPTDPTPTDTPAPAPTDTPDPAPTHPTPDPGPGTPEPTDTPTDTPTVAPTVAPTTEPTVAPTAAPTVAPDPTTSAGLPYGRASYFQSGVQGATVDPALTASFQKFMTSHPDQKNFDYPQINLNPKWAMSTGVGKATDPVWHITGGQTDPQLNVIKVGGKGFHMPDAVAKTIPTGTMDRPGVIVDPVNGYTVQFADAVPNFANRTISVKSAAIFWHDSSGLSYRVDGGDKRNFSSRGRIPDAMTIRPDLLAQRVKEYQATGTLHGLGHVLHVFFVETNTAAGVKHPMSKAENGKSGWGAEGQRLRLNPSVDVTKLGLSPAGMVLAKTLQENGMYLGDNSGSATQLKGAQPSQYDPSLKMSEDMLKNVKWSMFQALK